MRKILRNSFLFCVSLILLLLCAVGVISFFNKALENSSFNHTDVNGVIVDKQLVTSIKHTETVVYQLIMKTDNNIYLEQNVSPSQYYSTNIGDKSVFENVYKGKLGMETKSVAIYVFLCFISLTVGVFLFCMEIKLIVRK